MFENLIDDVTEKMFQKIALRTHPENQINASEANRRTLAYLSTDREGTTNAMRNVENAMLGYNNNTRAKEEAINNLRRKIRSIGLTNPSTITNLVYEMIKSSN